MEAVLGFETAKRRWGSPRRPATRWMFGGLVVAAVLAVAVGHGASAEVSGAAPADGWNDTSPGFALPDDTFLREQWWLFNFGQQIGQRVEGKADADIRAPEAWSITTGSPEVVVAVLDFGIDYDHPDFEGQLWTNAGETGGGREGNGVDDDANGYVDDWRGWDFAASDNDPLDEGGHGTAVSGVLAAKGGDGAGITGVAPGIRIMPLRVGDTGVDLDVTPAAIGYAARMGARIVVQSYTTEPSGIFDNSDAETAAMVGHPEILFVTGAGNDGNDYRDFAGRTGLKPCNNPTVPNLICVGGTDRFDQPWSESTFGTGRVHVAAPAESMVVAARPRQVVTSDGFDDPANWSPATDMQGGWTTTGVPPAFSFEQDVTASDGRALHLSQTSPGTESVGVLRYNRPIDLTGRAGCDLKGRVGGTMSGAAGTSIGLFRQSDQRRNAFGGELSLIGNDLRDAGDGFLPLSTPVRAHEPLELAIKSETRRGSSSTIDVRVDGFEIDCWNTQHSDRDYEYWAGTSFATPIVAGVAALVASAERGLDTVRIRRAILESVVEIPELEGLVQTGGRVDAYAALQRAAELAGGRDSDESDGANPSTTVGPAPDGSDGSEGSEGSEDSEDDTAAEPISFAELYDYLLPDATAQLGMPGGRGQPDPGAASSSESAAGGAADDADGGGLPRWLFVAALAAAGTMGVAVRQVVRKHMSNSQREQFDAAAAAADEKTRREQEEYRRAWEEQQRQQQVRQKEHEQFMKDHEQFMKDHPSATSSDTRIDASAALDVMKEIASYAPGGNVGAGAEEFAGDVQQTSDQVQQARQEWIDARTAELVASGSDPGFARNIAEQEFVHRYGLSSAGHIVENTAVDTGEAVVRQVNPLQDLMDWMSSWSK